VTFGEVHRSQGPSSAFLSASVCSPFYRLPLADLHPVRAITARPLATTPPPPSRPRAGIVVPHPVGRRPGSSPVPPQETYERPVAACSTPNGLETAPAGNPTPPALRLPFWVRCISHFHLWWLTTLTQVPPRQPRSQG